MLLGRTDGNAGPESRTTMIRRKSAPPYAISPIAACAPAVAACALAFAACARLAPQSGATLAAVSPLPSPHPPAWLTAYGPRGNVDTLAQVRITFAAPLIPLEDLEGAQPSPQL